MKVRLSINYTTYWGQTVYIYGSSPELGNGSELNAVKMNYVSPTEWIIDLDIKKAGRIEYTYLIKENDITVRREINPHYLVLKNKKTFVIHDLWNDPAEQAYLYTSGFRNSFFKHEIENPRQRYPDNTVALNVECPYIKKNETLIISGSSRVLGEWAIEKALHLRPIEYGVWQIVIDIANLDSFQEYKFAILDTAENKIVHWENGNNRTLHVDKNESRMVHIETLAYRYGKMYWKAAGVAIPVFSLRTKKSFGIGEFSDLIHLIDWAAITGQKIIQLLPINDTTISHSWTDSYPYNSISIYALHPMYLGLSKFPLKDKIKYQYYLKEAQKLNSFDHLEYEKVSKLKTKYLDDLFKERGEQILKSKSFLNFYETNEHWLFPYSCFCYFRDKNKTADYTQWKEYVKYDKEELLKLVNTNKKARYTVEQSYFTQYLLDLQLSEARKYAHENGVIMKGDIPIGISRKSVEAWMEPHLFNLDVQTGAPPDAFSTLGQNWGFPTYNWNEMAKDDYHWWKKRFRKMADYFDAYRIDHILGFFRIWEIPATSVQGLLGYFSPALPLDADEIKARGIDFDEYRMTKPYIHEYELEEIFGKYTPEIIGNYLNNIGEGIFELKESCNTQIKIKNLFNDESDERSVTIRNGLYSLCNQVMFIEDKYQAGKYHPRITEQYSYSFKDLDDRSKDAFNRLYDDFYYHRHNQFWAEQAMIKLPKLISATDMLVCGEDLGMIPECVPQVMNQLQILTLELERMPKIFGVTFGNLSTLPYESVCTTSTHDMSTIREWWQENKGKTQQYYNQILGRIGAAPDECPGDICAQIISNHLNSSSMLVIIPLQDWLSMEESLRRENPADERINVPSEAQHYWKYRMHLNLEELIKAEHFNKKMKDMIYYSGRK